MNRFIPKKSINCLLCALLYFVQRLLFMYFYMDWRFEVNYRSIVAHEYVQICVNLCTQYTEAEKAFERNSLDVSIEIIFISHLQSRGEESISKEKESRVRSMLYQIEVTINNFEIDNMWPPKKSFNRTRILTSTGLPCHV